MTRPWHISQAVEFFGGFAAMVEPCGFIAGLFGSVVKRGHGHDLDVVLMPNSTSPDVPAVGLLLRDLSPSGDAYIIRETSGCQIWRVLLPGDWELHVRIYKGGNGEHRGNSERRNDQDSSGRVRGSKCARRVA